MFIYLEYRRGTKKSILKELRTINSFSSIKPLEKNMIRLETKKSISRSEKKIIENTCNKIFKKNIAIKKLEFCSKSKKSESKLLHIFADVDSTLTRNGVHSLNRNVKSMINKFKEHNCNFYFCSGRSYQIIDKLRKMYHTGEYGIAENGGIIIGILGVDGKRGDRTQPDKLIKYLSDEEILFKIDQSQANHKTEHVLLIDSITETKLQKAIKNSGAKVEYHTSKNTYHISAKCVNKGTAIEVLTSGDELDLDPALYKIVAIGDSDLDLPMFKYAEKGYLAGKPDSNLAKKIKKLQNKPTRLPDPPKALEEMYKDLFPFG